MIYNKINGNLDIYIYLSDDSSDKNKFIFNSDLKDILLKNMGVNVEFNINYSVYNSSSLSLESYTEKVEKEIFFNRYNENSYFNFIFNIAEEMKSLQNYSNMLLSQTYYSYSKINSIEIKVHYYFLKPGEKYNHMFYDKDTKTYILESQYSYFPQKDDEILNEKVEMFVEKKGEYNLILGSVLIQKWDVAEQGYGSIYYPCEEFIVYNNNKEVDKSSIILYENSDEFKPNFGFIVNNNIKSAAIKINRTFKNNYSFETESTLDDLYKSDSKELNFSIISDTYVEFYGKENTNSFYLNTRDSNYVNFSDINSTYIKYDGPYDLEENYIIVNGYKRSFRLFSGAKNVNIYVLKDGHYCRYYNQKFPYKNERIYFLKEIKEDVSIGFICIDLGEFVFAPDFKVKSNVDRYRDINKYKYKPYKSVMVDFHNFDYNLYRKNQDKSFNDMVDDFASTINVSDIEFFFDKVKIQDCWVQIPENKDYYYWNFYGPRYGYGYGVIPEYVSSGYIYGYGFDYGDLYFDVVNIDGYFNHLSILDSTYGYSGFNESYLQTAYGYGYGFEYVDGYLYGYGYGFGLGSDYFDSDITYSTLFGLTDSISGLGYGYFLDTSLDEIETYGYGFGYEYFTGYIYGYGFGSTESTFDVFDVDGTGVGYGVDNYYLETIYPTGYTHGYEYFEGVLYGYGYIYDYFNNHNHWSYYYVSPSRGRYYWNYDGIYTIHNGLFLDNNISNSFPVLTKYKSDILNINNLLKEEENSTILSKKYFVNSCCYSKNGGYLLYSIKDISGQNFDVDNILFINNSADININSKNFRTKQIFNSELFEDGFRNINNITNYGNIKVNSQFSNMYSFINADGYLQNIPPGLIPEIDYVIVPDDHFVNSSIYLYGNNNIDKKVFYYNNNEYISKGLFKDLSVSSPKYFELQHLKETNFLFENQRNISSKDVNVLSKTNDSYTVLEQNKNVVQKEVLNDDGKLIDQNDYKLTNNSLFVNYNSISVLFCGNDNVGIIVCNEDNEIVKRIIIK